MEVDPYWAFERLYNPKILAKVATQSEATSKYQARLQWLSQDQDDQTKKEAIITKGRGGGTGISGGVANTQTCIPNQVFYTFTKANHLADLYVYIYIYRERYTYIYIYIRIWNNYM